MGKTTLLNCVILDHPEPVDIYLGDQRIEDIVPTGLLEPKGKIIDCTDLLVVPGMINGHHHSHENFHKGRYDNLPLELWMNYVRPLKPIPYTPRQIYLRTLISALETLRSGATTICDDVNASPILHEEHINAVFQAYEDIGIRAYVGITLFDKPFFRSLPFVDQYFSKDYLEILANVKSTPPDEILKFVKSLAQNRHSVENRVAYMATPSAPQRCSSEFLLKIRKLADDYDLPLMIHAQETRLQVITGQEFFNSTTVKHLYRLGILGKKTALIHAVWLNSEEIELLAKTNTTVQHNPYSNLKMGSGLCPIKALLDAGVNISLATDGCGSIETTNMLKTLSSAALLHKLRGDDPDGWIGAEEAWEMATIGGARALGRETELGALKKGYLADLIAFRLKSPAFVPLNNPLRQLVFAESGADLEMAFVNGNPVILDGSLTRIDEEKILQEILEEQAKLLPHIKDSEAEVNFMLPAYRKIINRCSSTPLAQETYQAKLN